MSTGPVEFTLILDESEFKTKGLQPKKYRVVSRKEANERNAGRLMRKAAAILKDRGWVKHTQLSLGGKMCMIGALHFAYCGNATPRSQNHLVSLADNIFAQWSGEPNIPHYNDHVAENKDEVLEIMLKFSNEFDPQGG